MSAGEYCNRDVVITGPETSITDAAVLMRQYHVGTLVIVHKEKGINKPAGILTDRDLVMEILAQKVPVDSVTVKDVMSSEPVTINENESLMDTLALMQHEGVRRVIVIDKQGALQGILTADDAIMLIAESMNSLQELIGHELSRENSTRH